MYYRNGKALVGTQAVDGKTYVFNAYGETSCNGSAQVQPEAKPSTPTIPAKPAESAKSTQYYVVKRGDTLSKIAKQYRCTVEEVVALNRIKNRNLIFEGQKLILPQK